MSESEQTDLENSIGDAVGHNVRPFLIWLGLGATVSAIAMWLWRHSIGGFCKWLWNGLKAPARIEELFRLQKEQCVLLQTQIHEAKSCAEFAMATSRIAWSFAECAVLQFDSLGLCLFANDYILRLLVLHK